MAKRATQGSRKTSTAASTRRKSSGEKRGDTKPATRGGKQLVPKPGELIVRMYRQGLGDCFLLAFGTEEGPRYVLIDCGVHSRQTDGSKRLLQVMKHLCEATHNKFHVVVATHEHADHLSGFVQKGSPFLLDGVAVEEVWLAWTEQRGDKQADKLRKKRGAAKRVIDKAVEKARQKAKSGLALRAASLEKSLMGFTDFERPADDSFDLASIQKRIEVLLKEQPKTAQHVAMILNQSDDLGPTALGADAAKRKGPSSNELAVALLMLKAERNVKYCDPTQNRALSIPGVDGVRAYVLGPPRKEVLLKKDLPTRIRGSNDGDREEFKEVYLSGAAGTLTLQSSPALYGREQRERTQKDLSYPFARQYERPFRDSDNGFDWLDDERPPESIISFFQEHYLDEKHAWRRVDTDWLQSTEQLALNLDSDTNNTSLVLAFEWGDAGSGHVLLFPGDAQVGNWLSWRDQEYKSGKVSSTAEDLLNRTILYKVGHHGSHNATVKRDPRETTSGQPNGVPFGLELMDDIIALIPVNWDAAQKKMPTPWAMPHGPLYLRLREKSRRRVLRSDLSVAPLDNREDESDLRPESIDWSVVPGLRGVKWRRSAEEFTGAADEPLCYDILFVSPNQ